MTLKELFAEYNIVLPDTEVLGITQNSAELDPGFVFFAVKGTRVDGHDFINDAVKRGAAAVVSAAGFNAQCSVPVIKVNDIGAAMAAAACKFYGNPSRAMHTIGITGTKGKTSISYLLESIFFAAGRAPAVFGTINYRVGGKVISKAPNTTPAALTLQKLIAQAAALGSKDLVMEVSSHALELKRTDGIDFDTAIFTNLQRDHLDFHNNFENYFAAKLKLFENLAGMQNVKQNRAAIINIDEEYGQKLAALLKGRVKAITYGINKPADFIAEDIKQGLDGVDFKINGQAAHINLLGAHNVYNALASVAAASHSGVDMQTALKGIAALKGVPGRMERVDLGQNFYVFVDFAYTNESMQRAFDAVSPFKKGRVTIVFGCGGQRDTTKRSLMGTTAARRADLVLVTKDNPRKEDATNIFIDILKGMGGHDNYKVIPDRREAVFEAVQKARAGDIVIIAGKGHEDYQILPAGTIHFSDREQAEEALKTYVQSAKI
jgi:UDP-N-acetylmuramoyl-L-alanyl-D-glutamate--2,6-diaminopimelate ligase